MKKSHFFGDWWFLCDFLCHFWWFFGWDCGSVLLSANWITSHGNSKIHKTSMNIKISSLGLYNSTPTSSVPFILSLGQLCLVGVMMSSFFPLDFSQNLAPLLLSRHTTFSQHFWESFGCLLWIWEYNHSWKIEAKPTNM